MRTRSTIRLAAAVMLPALVWAGMPIVRAADEKPAAQEKKDSPEAKTRKQPADYRGPLPFYYGRVVSPDQKDKIYAIQEKYAGEMKPLMAKIRELEEARNKEIDALLTPEQLKRVDEIRNEARSKAARPDGDAKPE